ncbi:4a-hydroxytetrahydrobiopterin dehydratase [Actinomadura viridis]|uniref:4a-hydroxytetrahydrobiopterin dehydratase n=1 Tax=Actinomadura viridis TaxID=58110 RepID=UPI0018CBBBD4|nr:4a-hydroxytetrahydrobiopterin dehydratase [Actinomadura viridis]
MSLRTPLTAERVAERLADTGWSGDTSEISRTFAVEYDVAMRIVAEVARVAIEMEHRPDIDIRWDRLRFAMTTHAAGDPSLVRDLRQPPPHLPCGRRRVHRAACRGLGSRARRVGAAAYSARSGCQGRDAQRHVHGGIAVCAGP